MTELQKKALLEVFTEREIRLMRRGMERMSDSYVGMNSSNTRMIEKECVELEEKMSEVINQL